MTRFYDEDDARVQADIMHARNKQDRGWLHEKGKQTLGAKLGKKARMFRDKATRDDIAFKSDLARRERKTPITMPKVGDK